MATIETITLRLNNDASADAFAEVNSQVESQYLALQPGYNPGTRITTVSEDGLWTISLRWDSTFDADNSMAAFSDADANQAFLELVDASTMEIGRDVEVASAVNPGRENARRLYLEGIRDGNVREAVESYTGDRYTQHSTGVRDGVEGFVEFFEPFVEKNPVREIEIVRSFVDGRYVFVQAAQNLNNGQARWVTTDLFDTDGNGKIVEHWDVIHELGGTNPSGHSQVDGAVEITDLHRTEQNKEVVRRLLTEAFCEHPTAEFSDFISAHTYVNHNPDAADGLDSLLALDKAARERGEALFYRKIHRIIGQGNFVVSFAHQVWNDIDYAAFDIFRLEDGLVVEHWDNVETLPAEADLVNSGKF